MSIYNEMVWSFHTIECVKQQEAYTVLVGVQLELTLKETVHGNLVKLSILCSRY